MVEAKVQEFRNETTEDVLPSGGARCSGGHRKTNPTKGYLPSNEAQPCFVSLRCLARLCGAEGAIRAREERPPGALESPLSPRGDMSWFLLEMVDAFIDGGFCVPTEDFAARPWAGTAT